MLRRLVLALNHSAVFFFIHIDSKSAIEPFTQALKEFDNVRFVKRTSVNWMGFSQVRVALTLIQEALAQDDFSYFSLLSGSDFPIKPNEFILDFFSQNKTEYINYWKLEDRPSWIEKVEYYYLTDVFPIRDYYPKITLRGLYWRLFFRLKHHLPKRKKHDGIIFYGGSDWWTLTRDCV